MRRTVEAAAIERTLVFTYVPQVDFAAHVFGLESPEYGDAMATAAGIWSGIAERLPAGAVMIGTADHGVPAIAEAGKILVRNQSLPAARLLGRPPGGDGPRLAAA